MGRPHPGVLSATVRAAAASAGGPLRRRRKLDRLLHSGDAELAALVPRLAFAERLAAERQAMARAHRIVVSTEQERVEQYAHPAYRDAIDVDRRRARAGGCRVGPRYRARIAARPTGGGAGIAVGAPEKSPGGTAGVSAGCGAAAARQCDDRDRRRVRPSGGGALVAAAAARGGHAAATPLCVLDGDRDAAGARRSVPHAGHALPRCVLPVRAVRAVRIGAVGGDGVGFAGGGHATRRTERKSAGPLRRVGGPEAPR
eukprot:ctg_365.g105